MGFINLQLWFVPRFAYIFDFIVSPTTYFYCSSLRAVENVSRTLQMLIVVESLRMRVVNVGRIL